MRFSTDDGRFGIVVSPIGHYHLFRFQLVIDDFTVGDDQGCILGSAMSRLAQLKTLEDPRLSLVNHNASSLISTIVDDESFHDDAVLSLAESLDEWLICAFLSGEMAVVLAREYSGASLIGRVLLSTVPRVEYDVVVRHAREYWLAEEAAARP